MCDRSGKACANNWGEGVLTESPVNRDRRQELAQADHTRWLLRVKELLEKKRGFLTSR
jgi:hypothetical protein